MRQRSLAMARQRAGTGASSPMATTNRSTAWRRRLTRCSTPRQTAASSEPVQPVALPSAKPNTPGQERPGRGLGGIEGRDHDTIMSIADARVYVHTDQPGILPMIVGSTCGRFPPIVWQPWHFALRRAISSRGPTPQRYGPCENHAATIVKQGVRRNKHRDFTAVAMRTGMRYIECGEPGGGRVGMTSIRHHHMWRRHE